MVTFSGPGVLDGVTVTGGRDERGLTLTDANGYVSGVLVGPGAAGAVVRNAVLRDNAAQENVHVGGLNAGYALVNVVLTGAGSEAASPTSAFGGRSNFSGPPEAQTIALDNVTIAENPGSIFAEANALTNFVTTVQNSVVWDNGGDLPAGTQLVFASGGDLTFRNTVFGPTNQCGQGLYACADVTVADPLLRDDGLFTLSDGSAAVDFGDAALLPAGLATDAAGRARVQGVAVDAGAFEGTEPVTGDTPNEVGPGAAADPLRMTVAPNPSGDRTTVTLRVPEAQDVAVAVYDALGRRVAVLHGGPVAAGAPLVLPVGPLSAGTYVVRAVGARASASVRLVLTR